MVKYTFVLLDKGREAFLARLQELGMVDVTSAAWEPSGEDRRLIAAIEERERAVEYLAGISVADVVSSCGGDAAQAERSADAHRRSPELSVSQRRESVGREGASAGATGSHTPACQTEPYVRGGKEGVFVGAVDGPVFEAYAAARKRIGEIDEEIASEVKAADAVRPWGEFDPEKVRELLAAGVSIEWLLQTSFTSTSADTEAPLTVDLSRNAAQIDEHIEVLYRQRAEQERVLAWAAGNKEQLECEIEAMKDRLQFNKAVVGGERAADDMLVIMEAWARESQQAEVDSVVGGMADVLYIKDRPTPDDEVPVELKNDRFASPFEFIADLYAKPRYGTMDLTRWFAPFYMLFFGFCLADAGYGLLILLGGILLAIKGSGAMKTIGVLSAWCGGAAVVFGFFAGSLFGIDIKAWFPAIEGLFFTSNVLFAGALAIGVLQILFAMVLKVITTTRAFGLKYALATIGWIVVIVSGLLLMVPGMAGVGTGVPKVVLYGFIGVGLAMMLFLNNPGKNILVNFGGGLWNTYNDVTGLLSDALSYIRLFAIGLSGGVLAAVFNDLAFGLSPDIPVVGQIVTLIILAIGHGLNLFMSTLSSMVHPLRLTFVEFYKNAGFEASGRVFEPLKKSNKSL